MKYTVTETTRQTIVVDANSRAEAIERAQDTDRSRWDTSSGQITARKIELCGCSDPGCPMHLGVSRCERPGPRRWLTRVYRIDMEDETGTIMCADCADDALKSGVFTTREAFRVGQRRDA